MHRKMVEKAVADGFVPMDGTTAIHVAVMERQTDGTYQIKLGHIDSNSCQFNAGVPALGLEEALDYLDAWERHCATKIMPRQKRIKSAELNIDAEYYRNAAREMGIPVGPEEKSLHHAARMKRTAMVRRRGGGPGC